MTKSPDVRAQLRELSDLVAVVAESHHQEVQDLSAMVADTLRSGGRLFFCGNGGSAADAQHLAAEYVVRFGRDRDPMAAAALTTDTSILTAAANDMGFDRVFARQVAALGSPGDLLILHSTSGESENLLRATEAARAKGIKTAALLAKGGGRLLPLVDWAFVVPTESTARAQELHLALGHIVCDLVERDLFNGR
jgi:D-sedoheptulose 7-phosphate isomerase